MLGFCLGLIKYVVLVRICFIDFREKIIKDRDLIILLVIGILLGVEGNNFEKVYLGWCAFSMPLLVLYIVEDYFKRELIGFGDVKLMIVIGGLLRYRDFRQVLLFYQNLYFLSAIIVILVLIYWKIRGKRGEYVPFAPYIILNYLLFENI
nr:prepilin peptidase [uncultured Leptotrichia sp.]